MKFLLRVSDGGLYHGRVSQAVAPWQRGSGNRGAHLLVPTSLAGALCGRDSSRLVAVGDSNSSASAPRAPGESGIRGVVIAHNYAVRVPFENG